MNGWHRQTTDAIVAVWQEWPRTGDDLWQLAGESGSLRRIMGGPVGGGAADLGRGLSRRGFLRASLAGSALLVPALSRITFGAPSRSLSFEHLHTGEKLSLVYGASGRHLPESLSRLNRFLRDHRTGEVHPIDPALFDLLHDVRTALGVGTPFQVISAYRSPETNRRLRASGRGVAKFSLHLRGKAIDLRLKGVPTWRVRQVAVALEQGGVGYYRDPNFVHIDTGRVRTW